MNTKKKQQTKKLTLTFFTLLITLALTAIACKTATKTPSKPKTPVKTATQTITLATTTSTQDSGLLDTLIPAFEKKYKNKIKVKVVAVGTGQAIELGKKGDADVLLVHSRKSEDEFVAQGYGTDAWDVMYNRFLIVGPKEDPAKIMTARTAWRAFSGISGVKANFISRGDDSGTDKKEKEIWKKANITPKGSWYVSAGLGMGETLRMASEKKAYTLTDEATFLATKTDLISLFTSEKEDKELLNNYGIILVKSTKKAKPAKKLINYIVGTKGQSLIRDFGEDKFGKAIFTPNAKKR